MQKKLTVLFAFAIFVLVVGWALTPAQAHTGNPCPHEPKNPDHKHCTGDPPLDDGGGGPVPVTVTFRDDVGDTIRSDSELILTMGNPNGADVTGCELDNCPYINKVDKVVALIRSTAGQGTANFVMHLSKFAIRTLFLDFRNCASGDTDPNCTPPFLRDFTVGPTNIFTSGVNLSEMAADSTITLSMSMSVGIDLNSIDLGIWRFFFGNINADCTGSSTIGVTRNNADTWVIEAEQDDFACLAEQVGAGEFEPHGLYRMPFMITVQKK